VRAAAALETGYTALLTTPYTSTRAKVCEPSRSDDVDIVLRAM